jgi:hypothetical protein
VDERADTDSGGDAAHYEAETLPQFSEGQELTGKPNSSASGAAMAQPNPWIAPMDENLAGLLGRPSTIEMKTFIEENLYQYGYSHR